MGFKEKVEERSFAVLAEMHTPKGVNTSQFVENALQIKDRIDAVVVPDMDNGIMRMSALAGGALLAQNGIEPIIHTYSRDRNRLALQGDALAAYALGIKNLVIADSELMSDSDHSETKASDDIDELQLLEAITKLQQGSDMSGFQLDGSPDFLVGCTVPSFDDDKGFEESLKAVSDMVEVGAQFVFTSSIYDAENSKPYLEKLSSLGEPVIARVFLLKSLAIAQYIASSEPGANISKDLISRIRKSKDRELEGIKVAAEAAASLKDVCDGVVIQTLGWEDRLPEILDLAGI